MKKLLLTTALVALTSPALAEEYTVKMVTNLDADQIYYFEPNELTIQPGDTVTFVNAQEDYHNVVFNRVPKDAENVESPMLEEEGDSWSYTFNVAGTYGFHCHPHAGLGMIGTLIVGEPSAPEDMKEGGHGEHDHGRGNEEKGDHHMMQGGMMMGHDSMKDMH